MYKSLCLTLVRFVVAFFCVAASAEAPINSFSWTNSAFNDPEYRGRYTVTLSYAVPETDNVQLLATCTTQGDIAVLAANTGELSIDDSVPVNFYQSGKLVYTKQGSVYQAGEEGISGVLFQLELNDDLWSTLERGDHIRYDVNGLPHEHMDLHGSTRAIQSFREDCSAVQIASAAEYSEPSYDDFDYEEDGHEENNVISAPSCDLIDQPMNVNAEAIFNVQFTNNSGEYRSIMQRDSDGGLQHKKDLADGESYSQQARVGEQWMFVDGPGNCKEIFALSGIDDTEFSIRFPN